MVLVFSYVLQSSCAWAGIDLQSVQRLTRSPPRYAALMGDGTDPTAPHAGIGDSDVVRGVGVRLSDVMVMVSLTDGSFRK